MAGIRDAMYARTLANITGGRKPSLKHELADISQRNTEIVEDILQLSRKHLAKKQYAEAKRLMAIAKDILNNNKKLQDRMGEL